MQKTAQISPQIQYISRFEKGRQTTLSPSGAPGDDDLRQGSALLDLHAHTRNVSRCSILSADDLIGAVAAEGSDGFALTNHFAPWHLDRPYDEWLKKYENEYFVVRDLAAGRSLTVLFGIEVTLTFGDVRKDFLMYGVEPSCLYESKTPLWDLPLSALFEFTHACGGLLIHAHPLRGKSTFADPRYLDGVEINCHPLYLDNQKEEITAFANEHGLLLTCGSDYHGDVYKAHCGVYLPRGVKTAKEFAAALKSRPPLLVHDIDIEESRKSNIHNRKE